MINEIAQKQIYYIAERCKEIKPLVVINSLTYNHEPYLKDALEGFVMQKTNFPFVAIVHEDASTDQTAEVLREYAEKYPDIIFPIYEKENQYSKQNGSINKIMEKAMEVTGAKFVALCEGDDYWIDPYKLQKQVDFLDSHPDYSFSFTGFKIYDQKYKKFIKGNYYKKNTNTNNIIEGGGAFISTHTIVYRKNLLKDYPDFTKNNPSGDYPLQIYLALKGKPYIINSELGVYRTNNPNSWVGRLMNSSNITKKLHIYTKTIEMLHRFDEFSNYKYHEAFEKRIRFLLYRYYINVNNPHKAQKYSNHKIKHFIKYNIIKKIYESINRR